MKSKFVKLSSWLPQIVAGLLVLLILGVTGNQMVQANSATTGEVSWPVYANSENPGVLPSNSKAFGKSYGEWSAQWWKWLFSMPVDKHPLFDTADCSQNQEGKVWFLGGTFITDETSPGVVVGKADRDCTVPTGKALFFPIMNAECSEAEGDGDTEENLRTCAKGLIDHVILEDLSATIDGVEINNLQAYQADSPLFNWGPLPKDNVIGTLPEGTKSKSVADGYYLLLAPLSAGDHTIDFAGRAVFPGGIDFSLDIHYDLTVRGQQE